MYIVIEVIPRLFCPAYSFWPVLIQTPLMLFKKVILIRNCKSVKVSNSGGLMLCADGQSLMLCSKINSVLQFIYWTSFHLLKVTDWNTKQTCEICWKITMKTPHYCHWRPLRKKSPSSELFWSVFSYIRTKYGEILIISPYSIQMRENADQNNSEYEHFSCSGRSGILTVNF